MIQQGQVDRILQAKPEELREIIEEAAGTLIFKKRKLEAQKKLESTRLNLSRIDDILKELDRQKKALKDQVEKATTYTPGMGFGNPIYLNIQVGYHFKFKKK
jgi:chromosome segregation protein